MEYQHLNPVSGSARNGSQLSMIFIKGVIAIKLVLEVVGIRAIDEIE